MLDTASSHTGLHDIFISNWVIDFPFVVVPKLDQPVIVTVIDTVPFLVSSHLSSDWVFIVCVGGLNLLL